MDFVVKRKKTSEAVCIILLLIGTVALVLGVLFLVAYFDIEAGVEESGNPFVAIVLIFAALALIVSIPVMIVGAILLAVGIPLTVRCFRSPKIIVRAEGGVLTFPDFSVSGEDLKLLSVECVGNSKLAVSYRGVTKTYRYVESVKFVKDKIEEYISRHHLDGVKE